ncbi:MAG: HAD-IIIC family phosphatase [Nitrosopumilus sp.]|uniref:HAD-IIIC family phosphatase n=1 Tax=Nitrosopumilus sp. TaxID=2024843 RepID=UPI002431B03C|nr:HAD-IIIC family phosphatase [Nitrosopumilus sp.]MCV0366630.1 HAD-IIIC family phosphatase [Nitrosopumilus sp.]
MVNENKLSYYLTKSKLLEKNFEKNIRIAILSSFTLNGIEETFKVKCTEKKINCETYLGSYNQYHQEILNPESNLYQFNPDIVFLILDTRSLLGDFWYSPYSIDVKQRKEFVQKKYEEIKNLIQVFTKKSKSKFIISNFTIPARSNYGICETKSDFSLQTMIIKLNENLQDFISNLDSAYLFDMNGFVTRHGENNVFDPKQYLFGDIKISLDYIPHLTNDLIGYVVATLGLSKRCIVLDLDNTLWGGIIGEDGFDGIKLGSGPPGNAFVEFQKYLLGLHNRGILLAINSKNNPNDALEVIENHPDMVLRKEHFACMKINWNDKVSNMKEISEDLNFGLENFVFIDDDPIHREFMKSSLPQVLTVDLPKDPSKYTHVLEEMNEFNVLKITDEDKKRGLMYSQQKERKDLEKSSLNLQDFLKNMELKVTIKKADDFTIPRISQLILKTNQFNLTTKRYQLEDIQKFSQDENFLIGCAQVEDKFGDNGITGAFIVQKNGTKHWVLDTFLLSCRVMGREVEKSILGHIIKTAKEHGVEKIKADFIPTQKNKPIENFLPDCGFKKEGDSWIISINETFQIPDFIKIEEK